MLLYYPYVCSDNCFSPVLNVSALQAYGEVVGSPEWAASGFSLPEDEPISLVCGDGKAESLALLGVAVGQQALAELYKAVALE